jgi:chromosomal replication initiator protein
MALGSGVHKRMAKLDQALWRDIMGYMREHHDQVCRAWFDQLKPQTLDQGVLAIQTPSSIQQQYLQRKCLEPFREAAQHATGNLVAVKFISQTSKRKKPAATRSDPVDGPRVPPPTNGDPRTGLGLPPPRVANPGGRPAPAPPAPPDWDADQDQLLLIPDYSFSNFITGPNNHLAHAAAIAVANQPGQAYNPLFIHGGVGLGKTHLLQAICQQILDNDPDTHILYVSCEAFMNQFIACVQSGQMNQFRYRYRHVDVLVIDDIHFLGSNSRERSQEEFFHTFNELYQSNRQIVLSSDAPPSQIPQLEDRLVSRFQWGLVAPVSRPSFETRVAIVRAKAQLHGIELPHDVVELVAGHSVANARELEGSLNSIRAQLKVEKAQHIDLAMAKRALGESITQPRSNHVTLQRIIEVVTRFYNLKLSDLQSRRRHKSVTEPRQVCMWLARKRTRFSLEEIGGHFGGRDHTTVMHSIKTTDARREADPEFLRQTDHLDAQISGDMRE